MNRWTHIRFGLAALSLIAAFAGCGEGDPAVWQYFGNSETGSAVDQTTSPAGSVAAMAVRPAYTQLTVGDRAQLATNLWLEDGSLIEDAKDSFTWPSAGTPDVQDAQDAQENLQWTTDNYGIAVVDGQGVVTAMSSGETMIRVRCRDHEATARIVVSAANSHDPNIDTGEPPP